MCGVAGFIKLLPGQTSEALESQVSQMASAVYLRGPDDAGAWVDERSGVALGHRRLSILDLSPAGHQPMMSASGRYVIAFNGEIYNHLKLRDELERETQTAAAPTNDRWRGHSDTETLLACIERWGLITTLQRSVGMFAICLWDKVEQTLYLARDRFGEKPLYYGWSGEGANKAFMFASELKALRAYPGFNAPVCRKALAQYLRFSYVPAPRTIYEGVFKLEPGCVLTVRGSVPDFAPVMPIRPGQAHGGVSTDAWWSLSNVIEQGHRTPITSETEATNLLEAQLKESVGLQSLADVPLGAFLSGGVDSSTIVALLQSQSSRPIKTFTIGFEEAGFDESPHAAEVARHLGTEHHEMRVTAQMAREVIPSLPHMYDEPFADSSQIPTHLVCKTARQHVTVALSGDAGDELFGGYNRYLWGQRIWNRLSPMPIPVRRALGTVAASLPTGTWDAIGTVSGGFAQMGNKVSKLATLMRRVRTEDDVYLNIVSTWQDPAELLVGENAEPSGMLDDAWPANGVQDQRLRMMYRDSMTYLPDDILCKVDRAAMACSLETRVPFLDHRVAELAWRFPMDMKIRENTSKWILRQVLYRHVPPELIERPKSGFTLPVGQWLRGPLRSWAEGLLDEHRLRREGYFHPGPIQTLWKLHLSGKSDHSSRLWTILMFQAWLEHNGC